MPVCHGKLESIPALTVSLTQSQVPRYTVDLRYAPDGGWPSATEQQLSDDTEAWLGEDALFVPGGATAGVEGEEPADADGPAISHATRRSNKTKRDRRKRTVSAADRAKGASVRIRDLCTHEPPGTNQVLTESGPWIRQTLTRLSQDEDARMRRGLGESHACTYVSSQECFAANERIQEPVTSSSNLRSLLQSKTLTLNPALKERAAAQGQRQGQGQGHPRRRLH